MPQKESTRKEYLKRINIVVQYINNHLDENIELTTLAELSNLSPFHFHRIMKAFLGEPIGSFITRMRIEAAAHLLRYSGMSIQEIAYQVGYDAPSSLSKVFRQFYGISPNYYRKNKNHVIMRELLLSEDLSLKSPKIKELGARQVIYIQVFGGYNTLDYSGIWKRLWVYVKENKLFSAGIEHIAIYHDDPKVTEEDKLRSDICLVLPKKAVPKGEVGVKEIPGGKYAVFFYQGSYDNLGYVYDTIYAKWLPESGCTLSNQSVFEKYLNNPENTPAEKLKTEIYLPIE